MYLYTYADGRLSDAGHLPLPRRGELAALPVAEGLLACDLDGDGRSELIAGLTGGVEASERERQQHTAVFHQRPDGGFERVVLGLQALACAQLDDDPADELVVSSVVDTEDPGRNALWALGAGDTPIPPRRPVAPPDAAPPSDDPLLVDRWTRAGQLVASGLTPAAVRLLRETAELAGDARVEQALLVRAAGLLQDADEARDAAGLYDRAARRLALPGPVALRAAEAHVALGEVTVADRLLRALVDDPGVDPATRTAAATRLQVLAALLGRPVALDFAEPLDPAWTLDPLALRRDPRAGVLRVEAARVAPGLAVLPLVWAGGAAALTVDLDVDHLESGANLEVGLVDADGHPLISVGVFAPMGLPRKLWISCHDPTQPLSSKFGGVPTTVTARRSVRARAMWDPARGAVTCDAEIDGQAGHFTSGVAPPTARAGPVNLVIASSGERPALVTADLRAITLHGVSRPPVPTAAPGPGQRAALLLVEDRPDEALDALADADDVDLWRFLADDRRREAAAATAALRAHLARHPGADDRLTHLFRLRPDRVGPPLRALLGPGVYVHVVDVLSHMFSSATAEPWVHEVLLTDFPWHDDLDATNPDTRLTILLMRAVALAASDRLDEARAFTRRALVETEAPRTPPPLPRAGQWFYLGRMLASAAPEEAIAAIREGIRCSPAPETTRRRARTRPEFDVLGADPAWLDLVGRP